MKNSISAIYFSLSLLCMSLLWLVVSVNAGTQVTDTAAGYQVGKDATELVGFSGAVPSAQRAGAAQAVVTATTITGAAGANPTQAEYAVVVARVNDLTALVNELRAALVEKGLIKGGT